MGCMPKLFASRTLWRGLNTGAGAWVSWVCDAGMEMSAQMRFRPAYRSLPASIGRNKFMPPMGTRPLGYVPSSHAGDSRPASARLHSSHHKGVQSRLPQSQGACEGASALLRAKHCTSAVSCYRCCGVMVYVRVILLLESVQLNKVRSA